jgi:hypothetical protein
MDALFDPVDHAASSAELSSADTAARARAHLRLSRQHEARAVLLAQQIGESAYNETMSSTQHPRGRMSGRRAAERASLDAVALGLRVSKNKAGRWMADGEALQRHPKIKARYLAGDFSTNRVEKLLRAAEVAPDVELTDGGLADGEPDAPDSEGRGRGEDDAAASAGGAPTLDDLLEDSPGEDGVADTAPDVGGVGGVGADGGVDADPDGGVNTDVHTDVDVDVDLDAGDADELIIDFEDLALDLADRPTTDKALEGALNDLIVDLDPDRAAEVRDEFAEAWQNITITTDAAGHTTIEICAPAEQGVFLGHRIRELLSARVCPADPRTTGQQRVMAHAELIGVPGARLDCRCGRDDCRIGRVGRGGGSGGSGGRGGADADAGSDVPSDAEVSTRSDDRGDQVDDIADSAAIDSPHTEAPHATSPVCDSSEDAGSGTGSDADTTSGIEGESEHPLDNEFEAGAPSDTRYGPSGGDSDLRTSSEADDLSGTDSGTTDPSAGVSASEQPPWTLIVDPTDRRPPRLRGYGAIDPELAADLAPRSRIITPTNPPPRSAGLIITDRAPAPPVDPTGHGGFIQPPPGALTYAPSARLRADVEGSDQTCRYPMCSVPAHLCQLDHLVKFDHADPMAGGWTLLENLIPLCLPDHQRKHMGLWIPTMHTDRTIRWRKPHNGDVIVTYPR